MITLLAPVVGDYNNDNFVGSIYQGLQNMTILQGL